ncbi:hypothetical protein KGF57_004894 [Candida theae]|uniref:Uncharacterized protein n=1 Tax=Candida theae TaxID=1198502 RepID=A0AAD5BAN5_9ASCO|nr:uncharacterized protein KGF57_004894 [Candida theae]KAI5949064.1 hypothetical protein KGF57_004894 [Candida theae]
MFETHEVLKRSMGGDTSRELNLHLRKYLEFLRTIKPISYLNPYVVSCNNYHIIACSESVGGCVVGGGAGNFAYSRAMGHHITSLIRMLEQVIDYYLESESFSFHDVDFMV